MIGCVYLGNIGVVICCDYSAAEEAFEHYSQRGADPVVLIADSVAKQWIDICPSLRSRHCIRVIVCNAVGPVCGGNGYSCVVDSTGRIVCEFPECAYQEAIDVPVETGSLSACPPQISAKHRAIRSM